jgi:orotate phosphoribosyltransferase
MNRLDDTRQKALEDLRESGVLMANGHFDYGNGYHGSVYLNPHQLFRKPSTIWRFAQDLLDVLPASVVGSTEVVTGPVTGGALLAHTIAGLLDSRRSLTHPSCCFAPFHIARAEKSGGFMLRNFYRRELQGRRVLLVDDVRNTGRTLKQCAGLIASAGGELIATTQIYDRGTPLVTLDVPNYALAEYDAPPNYSAGNCPLCTAGVPITTF